MVTTKQVLKAIGSKHLSLNKNAGNGYWYFIYDCEGKYETHSVYVMYLNDLPLDQWVEEGQSLVEKMS
jgi:hypothetical protein